MLDRLAAKGGAGVGLTPWGAGGRVALQSRGCEARLRPHAWGVAGGVRELHASVGRTALLPPAWGWSRECLVADMKKQHGQTRPLLTLIPVCAPISLTLCLMCLCFCFFSFLWESDLYGRAYRAVGELSSCTLGSSSLFLADVARAYVVDDGGCSLAPACTSHVGRSLRVLGRRM